MCWCGENSLTRRLTQKDTCSTLVGIDSNSLSPSLIWTGANFQNANVGFCVWSINKEVIIDPGTAAKIGNQFRQ